MNSWDNIENKTPFLINTQSYFKEVVLALQKLVGTKQDKTSFGYFNTQTNQIILNRVKEFNQPTK